MLLTAHQAEDDRPIGVRPIPAARLTPHSLSRLVRDLLSGDLGAHRHIPVDDEVPKPEEPVPAPVVERRVYSRCDAQRAGFRRHADLEELTGVNARLDEIDRRAADLNHRAMVLLDTEADVT